MDSEARMSDRAHWGRAQTRVRTPRHERGMCEAAWQGGASAPEARVGLGSDALEVLDVGCNQSGTVRRTGDESCFGGTRSDRGQV